MKKKILLLSAFFALIGVCVVFGEEAAKAQAGAGNTYWKWISAAAAVGLACIGGGIAVGQIGAAAMGAMSENPELSGKALPFIGLAEGICLWGFLVALLILFI